MCNLSRTLLWNAEHAEVVFCINNGSERYNYQSPLVEVYKHINTGYSPEYGFSSIPSCPQDMNR
jgi:hypothetical protein